MRLLIGCPSCKRQLDAGDRRRGDRLRCACGCTLEVPHVNPHEAAVVRCSACGAPRRENAQSCAFCGADFTVHHRDVETVCPSCVTRVSSSARYCHYCGTPIVPAGGAGAPTSTGCPACGPPRKLRSRRFAQTAVSVLECPRCAGLWLGKDAFDRLAQSARERAGEESELERAPAAKLGDNGYRPCPMCGQLMHRRNFGRKSGVLIDTCRDHGLWFDGGELESVLRWIRAGGETRVRRLEREEHSELLRRRQLERHLQPSGPELSTPLGLGEILERLFDLS